MKNMGQHIVVSKSKAALFESNTNMPLKMCAVVQMVLLHRKQEASEEILQHLGLLGDGKVSKVEERQIKIRLTGDASKSFHKKSCWM